MKKLMYKKKDTNNPEKKDKKEHSRSIRVRSFMLCFIAALVLYAVMLYIEKTVLDEDEKTKVYVAADELVKDTLITDDNASAYFRLEEYSTSGLPEGCVTDIALITGLIADRTYAPKEIITLSGFVSESERIQGIENPVEVSLNANTLSQVVGGVLRAGDYINIWSVQQSGISEKTTSAVQICSHAYVTRAFTSSGVQVDRDADDEQATTVINIVIPADKEEEFNIALANGTIRVGRCLYDSGYEEEADDGYKGIQETDSGKIH